jgi:hypothetical protein
MGEAGADENRGGQGYKRVQGFRKTNQRACDEMTKTSTPVLKNRSIYLADLI